MSDGQMPDTEPDTEREQVRAEQTDTSVSQTQVAGAATPEYADFDVDDFPAGLQGCLEAVLMSAEDPLKVEDLSRLLAQTPDAITKTLEGLSSDYDEQGRGFELVHSVRGWRFVSRAEYEPVVSAFITDKQNNRLSQAALEALAIIAYKQPITRSQVSSIRGVNSDGVIRSLMLRGFVVELGEEAETRARLLATTDTFLEKIGLASLEDLPALAPFLPDRNGAFDNDVLDNDALDNDSDAGAEDADGVDSGGVDSDPGTAFNQFIDQL